MKKEYEKPELNVNDLGEASVIVTSLYNTGKGTTEGKNGGVFNGEFDTKQRNGGFYAGWDDEYDNE